MTRWTCVLSLGAAIAVLGGLAPTATPAMRGPAADAHQPDLAWATAWGTQAATAIENHTFVDLIVRSLDYERFCVAAYGEAYTSMSSPDRAATRSRSATFFASIYAEPQINADMASAELRFERASDAGGGVAYVHIAGDGGLGMRLSVTRTPEGVRVIDMERNGQVISEVFGQSLQQSGLPSPLEFTGLVAEQMLGGLRAPSVGQP